MQKRKKVPVKAVKPTTEWQFSGGIVFYSGGASEVSTILNISVGIMTLAFWGSYLSALYIMVCTRRNQKQVKALNFTTWLVCEKKNSPS